MEFGDKVVLDVFVGEKLVGLANVDRNKDNRKRGRHIGIFGISVDKDYRGEGIGYNLAKAIIEEAKKQIIGLKMIIIDVYSLNQKAITLYKKLGFIEYGLLKKRSSL